MAFRTDPPDLLMGPCCDHLGCQLTIESRMPLRCYLWRGCGKVIKSCKDFLPGTVRATGVLHGTHTHSSNIVVPEGAAPPYSTLTGGRHLRRKQCSVLCGMTLLGQFRKLTGKIVDAESHSTVGAHRAAKAICAGMDGCTPYMAMAAPLPYLFLTSGQHTLRCQR